MAHIKYIDGKDLNEVVELKAGMVIQLRKKNVEQGAIHNMVIVPCGDNFIAIEELISGDTPIFSKRTSDNYCFLNKDKYPETMGIEDCFGDEVIMIYPHLGWCNDNEDIIKVTDTDENGRSYIRFSY